MALTSEQRRLVADMFHQLIHGDGRVDITNILERRKVCNALSMFVTLEIPANLTTFEGDPRCPADLLKTFVAMLHFGLPIDVSELDRESTTYKALLFAAERVRTSKNN